MKYVKDMSFILQLYGWLIDIYYKTTNTDIKERVLGFIQQLAIEIDPATD